jgi:polyhydroxyalkanoate synthesis regulator phasin
MKTWQMAAGAIAIFALTACGGYHGGAGHGRNMDAIGAKAEQEVAKLLDETVQDAERAKQAKAIVAEMIEEIKASSKQQREFHRKLYEMNANYNAAPEDFTKILDDASNQRMRSAAMILALRFKLKETLKLDEWKALSEGMNRYRSRYWQDKDGAAEPAGVR